MNLLDFVGTWGWFGAEADSLAIATYGWFPSPSLDGLGLFRDHDGLFDGGIWF